MRDRRLMANGLTSATKEDAQIQADRWERAVAIDRASGTFPNRNYRRQCVGWSIGRGFEADYLEAIHVSDAMRYTNWLKWAACLPNWPNRNVMKKRRKKQTHNP